MKKVLIFSTAYYPHVGGAEIAIKEITDRVSDIEFDLICARLETRLPRQERIGNVMVHRIGPGIPLIDKLLLPWVGAYRAIALGRVHAYDAYWCMMVTFASGAAYLANIFSRRPIPIVLTLQEGDSEAHLRRRWFGLLHLSWLLALRHARIVTAISTYLKDRARTLGYRGELSVIPNGVDVQRFSRVAQEQSLDEMKDSLEKKLGDIFLITTSRLVRKNAVDDVLRALPQMPAAVRFIVLGTGPDELGLKDMARRLRIGDRVRFLGHVDHARLPLYLHASDIFIRPSRSEGMGNSFIEAMAAGLPVIATQEGGIADFLFDERRDPDSPVTGWAVDADSPDQIAEAVRRIIDSPEKTRAVVRTAREMVIERYDWDAIAKRMHDEVFMQLFSDDSVRSDS